MLGGLHFGLLPLHHFTPALQLHRVLGVGGGIRALVGNLKDTNPPAAGRRQHEPATGTQTQVFHNIKVLGVGGREAFPVLLGGFLRRRPTPVMSFIRDILGQVNDNVVSGVLERAFCFNSSKEAIRLSGEATNSMTSPCPRTVKQKNARFIPLMLDRPTFPKATPTTKPTKSNQLVLLLMLGRHSTSHDLRSEEGDGLKTMS